MNDVGTSLDSSKLKYSHYMHVIYLKLQSAKIVFSTLVKDLYTKKAKLCPYEIHLPTPLLCETVYLGNRVLLAIFIIAFQNNQFHYSSTISIIRRMKMIAQL